MKHIKKILAMCLVLFCFQNAFSQIDTNLVNQSFEKALKFENGKQADSAIIWYEKTINFASELTTSFSTWSIKKQLSCLDKISNIYLTQGKYDNAIIIADSIINYAKLNFGDNSQYAADAYNNKGLIYYYSSDFDQAIEFYFKSLKIRKDLFGEKHKDVADSYNNIGNIFSIKSQFDSALEYYFKGMEISLELLGEKNTDVSISYNNIGIIYCYKSDFDKALVYFLKSLEIRKELLGEKHMDIADSYNNIGIIYSIKSEYDRALEYYLNSLEIQKELLGEKHPSIAKSYINIGILYIEKSQSDKALEYFLKSIELQKELLGEKHIDIAASYNNIGSVYQLKSEYDKALEYLFKGLEIHKELLGEKNIVVASTYNNIGNIYIYKSEFNKAIEYCLKSLEIRKELLGEKNIDVANSYNNIGAIYHDKSEYNKALEYYLKSIEIRKELLGEKNIDVAVSYNDIGAIYNDKSEYDKALEYYLKSLEICKELLGKKHVNVAISCNNIGHLYSIKKDYDTALKYYQLGIVANIIDFNDTINISSVPTIKNYIDWNYLLKSLNSKSTVFLKSNDYSNVTHQEKSLLNIILKHYQASDTLIDQTRKKITTLSDKLSLGESATMIYEGGIKVCLQLAQLSEKQEAEEYKEFAFYFSEQNKSQVLLQALSGQEAQKFAGIPDSLLEKEYNLKSDINFFEQKLAEGLDSITERNFRDRLFAANRQYEELISNFETSFPEYFNLKYSTKNPSIKDLQKLLDAKTAIRSYFVGDSSIYIFTISNKKFDVQQVAKIDNLEDTIRYFRYGLTKFSERMTDIYRRTGVLLYNQLFPETPVLDKQIENLIIIPDGALATIPFEALLTDNSGSLNGDDFKKYPFLINRYNVSYSYSANLFYRTFPKDKQKQPEFTNINDWLALAPVFDDKNEQGVMLATRELQKQLNNLQSDTLNVRGRLLTGNYITPLPGTESETQAIIKQYENRNLKAQVLLHNSANEQFIKSGALEKYKVLHFATHGFVNSEKPELSGILLAQDSTGNQDGVLYSGEIYNLKLNADLVVLSACETGLGKINKGEGIIGLTRALLYAGSKNIIVSLWQVSDESTSNLMIDFYNNLLKTKNKSFSDPLRKAKLKMISEGKFAHPFYWSPFILIGK